MERLFVNVRVFFLQDEEGVAGKWLGMGRLQRGRHLRDEVRIIISIRNEFVVGFLCTCHVRVKPL